MDLRCFSSSFSSLLTKSQEARAEGIRRVTQGLGGRESGISIVCVEASKVKTSADPASTCFFRRLARKFLSRDVDPEYPRVLISSESWTLFLHPCCHLWKMYGL